MILIYFESFGKMNDIEWYWMILNEDDYDDGDDDDDCDSGGLAFLQLLWHHHQLG